MKINERITKRGIVVLVAFILLWLLICGVLFDIQILSYDYYQKKVINQITKETSVTAERGDIYDANMNLLAGNKTVWLVFISPQDIINAMGNEFSIYALATEDAKVRVGTLGKLGDLHEASELYIYTDSEGNSSSYTMDKLVAKGLSEILGVDYNNVLELTKKKNRYYEVIKKNVEKAEADLLREFIDEYGLEEQIHLTASTKRYYPNNTLACHVIGFVNSDGDGVYGIESYYNDILKGTSGSYITSQGGWGNDMPDSYENYLSDEDGLSVITTIDSYIQYELESVLEETLAVNKAGNRASGIVMDVNTGGILAMATVGGYDLNEPYTLTEYYQTALDAAGFAEGTTEYKTEFYNQLYTMWNNKAVTELYEPGSTFKIITSAMALELGVVTTSDNFTCSGSINIEGYSSPISCHKRTGHGKLNFASALQQSCNPAFVNMGFRIGRDNFYNYFKMFGYGSRSGIDLPGEALTIYHSYQDFTNVSLAVCSFGQTFKVTPIQHLSAIAAVANGGYLVTPHVMKSVIDDDGNVIDTYTNETKRQVLSQETCSILASVLEEGVSGNGGAKNAYVAGYAVAAKTGTSQKRDKLDENGEDTLRVGSCVAFAPADDPQVAVLILVDEPSGDSVYGSVVAAPYVSKLLSFVLPYLGFEPQYSEDEIAAKESVVSKYEGLTVSTAVSLLEKNGFEYRIVGDGDTVTAQSPASGTIVSEISKTIVIYTDGEEPKNTVEVPSVVGKTAEAANRLIINADLNIRINGAANFTSGSGATVISQYPEAGMKVPEGTVITLEFMHLSDITD